MTIVVFGARGRVGRQVLGGLLAAGEQVRAATRRESPDFEAVTADLERPDTLVPALTGINGVFLYAVPAGIDGFVTAARAAGVRRVVLLSSASVVRPGARDTPISRRHRVVEEALESSGMEWTFLRSGMFATNTIGLWSRSVRRESTVRLAFPSAHSAPVHEADLAALAVAALTTGDHSAKAYTVYGPESLTLRDQVGAIAAATGRPIAVEEVTEEAARAQMSRSMPEAVVAATLRTWAASDGKPVETSTVVADVLGRPARTFAEWATDHADDFR
ncbi:NAD(P)H-binding protein [Actinoplanes sp. NPDC020271]|uniref:NAD(P)H-binding protein n=1 Tax=Actinoplanes sp. NPDC020271 TaxID=3363896 RepID=UPI0037A469EE